MDELNNKKGKQDDFFFSKRKETANAQKHARTSFVTYFASVERPSGHQFRKAWYNRRHLPETKTALIRDTSTGSKE